MGAAGRVTDGAQAIVRAAETARGRRAFWALVVVAGLVAGALTVVRAEAPRTKLVEHPQYRSPTEIGEGADAQVRWRSSEFRAFRIISWGVIHENLDPYKGLGHVRAYPPFFGIAFYPFTAPWRIPGLGSGLFFLVSYAFALLAAWCVSRWGSERPRFGHFALISLLIAPLAFNAILRCETDLLILFPIALGFLWIVRGRRLFEAGLLLGFAASFKVLPGLFGLYLICTRQWKALGGMVAGGLLCTVLLPVLVFGPARALELHRSWYEVVVAPYRDGRVGSFIGNPYRPSNQSMTAGINRLLRDLPMEPANPGEENDWTQKAMRPVHLASLPAGRISGLVKTLQLAVLAALVVTWIACMRRAEPRTVALLTAAVAPGILLLSEVSLTTHHVLLLLPVGGILVRALAPDDRAAHPWVWAPLLYVFGVCLVGIPFTKPYTPLFPVTVILLAACLVPVWRAQGLTARAACAQRPAMASR